jgi:hypothetical protein
VASRKFWRARGRAAAAGNTRRLPGRPRAILYDPIPMKSTNDIYHRKATKDQGKFDSHLRRPD